MLAGFDWLLIWITLLCFVFHKFYMLIFKIVLWLSNKFNILCNWYVLFSICLSLWFVLCLICFIVDMFCILICFVIERFVMICFEGDKFRFDRFCFEMFRWDLFCMCLQKKYHIYQYGVYNRSKDYRPSQKKCFYFKIYHIETKSLYINFLNMQWETAQDL